MIGMKSRSSTKQGVIQQQENTYQLEPNRRFQSFKAKRLAESLVHNFLKEDTEYCAETGRHVASTISAKLLQQLKALNFDRYRYVVQTYIGQKRNQGMQIASRALTEATYDSFAEFTFENKTMWCVVVIHGIYLD